MNQTLLFNDVCEPAPQPTVKSYTWVQTRLVREAGPFYRATIKKPEEVVELLNDRFDLENCDTEKFVAIYMDRKGQVNSISVISMGGTHCAIVHPREVFKAAILSSSESVILAHNHPTGIPTPSQEDCEITRRLIEAGKIMGIEILDHVIVGHGKFKSLKSMGLL